MFSCGILAMKCDEQVVDFVQSLTNEVNENEGSGLKAVLEAINECERQKSDFQSRSAKSFKTCLNLTDLNLYYNGTSEAGATSIAEAIKGNKILTNLDLCSRGINKTLTSLDLSDNGMSEASATSIAEEIKVN